MKLKGAKKEAFLKRMAAGRRRAARAGGAKKGRQPNRTHRAKKNVPPPIRNRRRRRNQEEGEAAAMYETFHQRPATKTTELSLAYTYPADFAELGTLKELRFDLDNANRGLPLTGFKDCKVVCTPDGANIFFLGGDQSIPLDALDISSDKDYVELGPCTYIMYHTQKGFHDFEPIDYYHQFGEEDGIVPVLVYDQLNHALFLVSGNYRVRADGIEN